MESAEPLSPQKTLETGSFVCAWLTVITGVLSIWDQLMGLKLDIACHNVISSNCNPTFRMVFPVNPILLFEQWAPVMAGLAVVSFHMPEIRVEWAVPNTNTKLGIVHLVTALWVNFGYAGTFGVLVGFLNCSLALFAFYLGRPGEITCEWVRQARERLMPQESGTVVAPRREPQEFRPTFAPPPQEEASGP
jgi:hypothetical protein